MHDVFYYPQTFESYEPSYQPEDFYQTSEDEYEDLDGTVDSPID